MDLSQFTPTNKNETLLLGIVKLLHKIEENTYTNSQETLNFKTIKPKRSLNFDKPLIIPEKWLMGLSNLQVYNTVYKIIDTLCTWLL